MEHNWFIRPSEGRRQRQENELDLTSAFNYRCQGVCIVLLRKSNQTISHSSEEQRRPEGFPVLYHYTVTEMKLLSVWTRLLLQPLPSQAYPWEHIGEKIDVHLGYRSHRLQFQAAGTSLTFYSNWRILVASLLFKRRGSKIASLAFHPFDKAVETIYDCNHCQIALLYCNGPTSESYDSHRVSWVKWWYTAVLLHLNYKLTKTLCSTFDWKTGLSSLKAQDNISCSCGHFYMMLLMFYVWGKMIISQIPTKHSKHE